VTVPTGLIPEGAAEAGFAAASRSFDQVPAILTNPVVDALWIDLGELEDSRMAVADVFQAGINFQLSLRKTCHPRLVGPPQALALDPQGKEFLNIQIGDVALDALFSRGLEHSVQTEAAQLSLGMKRGARSLAEL